MVPFLSGARARAAMKLLCVLGAMAVAAACDDEDVDPFSTVQTGHQIDLRIARTTIGIGDTVTAVPAITQISSGDTLKPAYTFSSTSTATATVTAAGLVRGVAAGTTRIIARTRFNDSSYVDTVQVTVTP
jgi:hypothetical protein